MSRNGTACFAVIRQGVTLYTMFVSVVCQDAERMGPFVVQARDAFSGGQETTRR